jgi:lantibiotic modifying enzyme
MNSSRNQFLETASRIGARICRDAIWSQGRCNWLGDSMEKLDGAWKVAHRALGPDFYGGTCGIALFLDRLHALTGEPLFRETAEGAMLQACSRIPHIAPSLRRSFYLGLTGIAYTFLSMGLEDKARHTLEPLTRDAVHAGADGELDVIAGIAGAIPPLLAMASALSGDALLDAAIDYGEQLLQSARKTGAGWSWNTMNVPPERRREDLTGFSHGAAGIAWSLSELFQATKEERFREAAEEARRYENSQFDQRFSNWPDFRYLYDPDTPGNNGPGYPVCWCHGAPGIGLERLRAFQIFGDRALKEQAEIAIRTTIPTLAFQQGWNFSLCHGIAGNAELLVLCSSVFEDSTRLALAEQIAEQGIQQIERQDLHWPCGVTEGDETPNLMLGTAGIGYFYLRLYDSRRVPSVLIVPAQLEPRTFAPS